MAFLDPIKDVFRNAAAESARKTEEERIKQAFANGVVLGLCFSMGVITSIAAIYALVWPDCR